MRRLCRGTTPQPPSMEMGTKPPQPTFTPSQEGVRVTWEWLRSLGAITNTLPNKKHRHAFCNTSPNDIKRMEHCTAHNHTRQQHNIHSARYVGQPCAGSCSPKEHGAVRTGSLRNVNNNNNPSPRREIKCYHGADLRASAQRVVSAPISAAHGFWHHKGILNCITHPPTLIRLRHFKNPSLRTSPSINSYSGTPLSQLSFLSSQHPSHHSSILLVVFLSLLILPHPTHTLFVSLSPHILPTCPNQLTPHCSQNLYELLHTYSSSNSSS